MAAIVKANLSLTAGGLAVLRREYSTSDDGTLNYDADYVCLAQFARNHAGKFRTGATPPTPIPAAMTQLSLVGSPTLYDFTTKTQNGLTYFYPRYSAASRSAGEVILTESQEQRSFSAQVEGSIQTAGNFGSTSSQTGLVNVSFDYLSTTVRVESKSRTNLPNVVGRVSRPFNVSVGSLSGVAANISGTIRTNVIESQAITRSSRGTFTYTKSSSGIYQAIGQQL